MLELIPTDLDCGAARRNERINGHKMENHSTSGHGVHKESGVLNACFTSHLPAPAYTCDTMRSALPAWASTGARRQVCFLAGTSKWRIATS
jgi:hypothetical protein